MKIHSIKEMQTMEAERLSGKEADYQKRMRAKLNTLLAPLALRDNSTYVFFIPKEQHDAGDTFLAPIWAGLLKEIEATGDYLCAYHGDTVSAGVRVTVLRKRRCQRMRKSIAWWVVWYCSFVTVMFLALLCNIALIVAEVMYRMPIISPSLLRILLCFSLIACSGSAADLWEYAKYVYFPVRAVLDAEASKKK